MLAVGLEELAQQHQADESQQGFVSEGEIIDSRGGILGSDRPLVAVGNGEGEALQHESAEGVWRRLGRRRYGSMLGADAKAPDAHGLLPAEGTLHRWNSTRYHDPIPRNAAVRRTSATSAAVGRWHRAPSR